MSKVFKAIGNAVTSVVKAVVNVVSTVVKAVVNVVSDVINFIASPFMGLLGGMPSVPDSAAEAQRQDGVLLTKQGGGAVAIPVVYGYRKLGGVITFCETGSANNKYLWVAYTFAEGPVEGLFEISIDDTQLSVDVVRGLNSGQIVDVPDAKYKGRVKLQWFPGVYFSEPSQSPVGTISILKDAPSWKPSMVYNGMAVLMARYEWLTVTTQAQADANPFSGGIPQVQISLLGKKVASLRTGAGTENYNYQGSGYLERYSTNPAEILLDYLRNPRYGKGLVNTDIDWDSFYVAAQKCNQEIAYTTSVNGPILTMNIVLDTNQTLFANIKNLLANFRAYLPYVQGKYKLKIEDAGNPTDIKSGAATIAAVFNRDSILGDITYTGIERSAKYNQVVVSYVDPDQKFSVQQVVYPEDEAARQVYIGYDGGRENKSEVTFSGITNQQIARDFARLIFNKSRFQESCSLTVTAEGFNLEPGDNVYINSNILNFGTTPWRIVSIKLNNDYTFDLGCVRNPDFIYPYVIPNTPDTVIAPYIPKGASILPPLTGGQSLIGLVPPSTAPLLPPVGGTPVEPINTGTNPPSTITTGTFGGGIGGADGVINLYPTPPKQPIIVNVLTNFVTFDSVTITSAGTGLANADITFNQPDHAMYAGLQVYYKFSSSAQTVWSETFIDTKPGSGKPITFRITNLLATTTNASYDFKTRVKYSTGEYSTVINKVNIVTAVTGTTNPADYQETVASGWSLATTSASARNDYVSYIVGAYVAGATRSLDITVQQDLSSHAINSDITGIKCYYKPSASTYWDESLLTFSSYVAGTKTTVRLGGLGVTGAPDSYDIIVRFAYRDGSESTWQVRYMGWDAELASFDPFYAVQQRLEQASAYSFQTTSMGVLSGTISDVRDTKIGIIANYSVGAGIASNSLQFQILPPSDATALASWLGVNLYYRKVVAGTNPAYTQVKLRGMATGAVGSVVTRYFNQLLTYDEVYQFLVVPVTYYSGAETECRNGWFGQGSFHTRQTATDYPTDANWVSRFGWRTDSTSNLLGVIQTGFAPADPVPTVNSWKALNDNVSGGGAVLNNVIPVYYQVVFDVSAITSFNEAYIWRRHNGGLRSGYSTYFGFGRWEKITLTTAFSGYSSGKFTVNLKLPVSFREFNSLISANNSTTLYSTFPVSPVKPFEVPNFGYEEFYIQIKSAGSVSTKAIKLPSVIIPTGTAITDITALKGPPTTVVFADAVKDSQFNSGWNRTLAEARTATNASPLSAPYIYYNGSSGATLDWKAGTI